MLWGAAALSLVLTLLVIYTPFLSDMFSLVPLTPKELLASFAFALTVVPAVEAVKLIQRKLRR